MPRRKRRFASRVRDALRSLLAFLFSNIGVIVLVVGYTIAGAFMFQAIEGEDEMERAILMVNERNALAQFLWQNVTVHYNPLNETAIKIRIREELYMYQKKIVLAARHGWDGDRTSRQWSFSSAFLYSLTVITTIGYGHLSPRTAIGKILTIFYALLGMPLFLLYLTNVGELLARWFKCIYALVCLCRGCPGFRMRRVARLRTQLEISDVESIERPESWRNDPAFNIVQNNNHPDFRYRPNSFNIDGYPDRDQDRLDEEEDWDIFPPYKQVYAPQRDMLDRYGHNRNVPNRYYQNRDQLNRYQNRHPSDTYPPFREAKYRYPSDMYKDERSVDINNAYSINDPRLRNIHPSERHHQNRELFDRYHQNRNPYDRYRQTRESRIPFDARYTPYPKKLQRRPDYTRSVSMPMAQHYVPPRPAPRGWSVPVPVGVHSESSSEFSYVTFDAQTITVPISVCVAIMVGYLIFGSMLFRRWEDWGLLDGSYFCFISLSSIGFGDFVPGERVYTERIEAPFIVCSMYLMLGMALVAMCFNLMQEQVIHYFAGMKRALKRICRCRCKR